MFYKKRKKDTLRLPSAPRTSALSAVSESEDASLSDSSGSGHGSEEADELTSNTLEEEQEAALDPFEHDEDDDDDSDVPLSGRSAINKGNAVRIEPLQSLRCMLTNALPHSGANIRPQLIF